MCAGQVLAKMIESVSGTGGDAQGASALKSLAFDDEEDESVSQNLDAKSSMASMDVSIGANNIRVKVRTIMKCGESHRGMH